MPEYHFKPTTKEKKNMPTAQQDKAIGLIQQIEALKEQLKPLQKELDATIKEIPANEMFQDEETKLVYRIVPQTGTYVEFKPLIYQRTRKEGEAKGTVSQKEAEEWLKSREAEKDNKLITSLKGSHNEPNHRNKTYPEIRIP
jgi:hypothetical protein